jgi:hypothetical protein
VAIGGRGGATGVAGASNNRGGASGALGGNGGRNGTGGRSSSGTSAAAGRTAAGNAPSWDQLWTNYFQPKCASCHADSATVSSRRVFNTAAQLCTFLTNQRQLNGTTNPPLISQTQSVLNWFNPNGSMPEKDNTTPTGAVADIKAWATAGAVCP